MRKSFGEMSTVQLFSAPKRQGIEEAYARLEQWLYPPEEELMGDHLDEDEPEELSDDDWGNDAAD